MNCDNGIVCCRTNSTLAEGADPTLAGKFGTNVGNCDIPKVTYESFLDFAKENVKPDMVFFLGDNEDHEIDTITGEVNLKVAKYLSDTMVEAFGNST